MAVPRSTSQCWACSTSLIFAKSRMLICRSLLVNLAMYLEGRCRGGGRKIHSLPMNQPTGRGQAMARVLIPLPSRDFDPTEAAVTWKVCSARGHRIVFATTDGAPAAADDIMLTGCGLDPWGFVPGLDRLRLVGLLMSADSAGREAYAGMTRDPACRQPRCWRESKRKGFRRSRSA